MKWSKSYYRSWKCSFHKAPHECAPVFSEQSKSFNPWFTRSQINTTCETLKTHCSEKILSNTASAEYRLWKTLQKLCHYCRDSCNFITNLVLSICLRSPPELTSFVSIILFFFGVPTLELNSRLSICIRQYYWLTKDKRVLFYMGSIDWGEVWQCFNVGLRTDTEYGRLTLLYQRYALR